MRVCVIIELELSNRTRVISTISEIIHTQILFLFLFILSFFHILLEINNLQQWKRMRVYYLLNQKYLFLKYHQGQQTEDISE